MKTFKDKVAVITGAASGIGLGIAERCFQEGMKVVLADIEEPALTQAAADLKAQGGMVLAVQTDVSKVEDIEALAQKTMDAFGEVHFLFNNAGVAGGSTMWESHAVDWEWVMGVNLYGVIYGVRVFVPIMLEQDSECHIINTASIAGLITGSELGIYGITKHAVVALSETLFNELVELGSKIRVSVLCPGWVKTRILESARNRPAELQLDRRSEEITPENESGESDTAKAIREGMSPQQVAKIVFEAIQDEKFYILTHPESNSAIQVRMENILQGRNPT